VIEDEQKSKNLYEEVFRQLSTRFPLLAPHYAFCYTDAVDALSRDEIYHLVILDLRLPREPGEPPAEGVDLGLQLADACGGREKYPVPALLVITGHLPSTDQTTLRERVEAQFAYGQLLAKGQDPSPDIERALEALEIYCDVGVHLQDPGGVAYPALTPRDENLLRRAVLRHDAGIGVDLRWWSADRFATAEHWTNVFLGAFLLTNGRGRSRPNFFKFADALGASDVASSARLLEDKLNHIKVKDVRISGGRSLLVTETVSSDRQPVSLPDVLGMEFDDATSVFGSIAKDISDQIKRIGDTSPNQAALRTLLWPFHNRERIDEQVRLWDEGGAVGVILHAFDQLAEKQLFARYQHQATRHGDLHLLNVALETIGRISCVPFPSGLPAPSTRA
jgi:hypothetical protein